jgi:hypothetical protein
MNVAATPIRINGWSLGGRYEGLVVLGAKKKIHTGRKSQMQNESRKIRKEREAAQQGVRAGNAQQYPLAEK